MAKNRPEEELPPPSYQSVMNLLQRVPITQQPVVSHYNPPVGPNATEMTCPACNHSIETRLTHQPNMTTHIAAVILCMLGCYCCCCVPYCTNCYQDTIHSCPKCVTYIGTSEVWACIIHTSSFI